MTSPNDSRSATGRSAETSNDFGNSVIPSKRLEASTAATSSDPAAAYHLYC